MVKKFTRRGTKNDDYFESVATSLIAQIEAGTAPWQKPWQPGIEATTPINASTGKPYNGMNRIWLEINNPSSSDPRWCTYNQAQDLGAQVRKGEKGTKIQFWRFDKEVVKKDDNGKPVKDANGKPVKERVKLEKPMVMTSTVFHATQMDGLPPFENKASEVSEFQRHERCEKILENSGAHIRHERGDRAFYTPTLDSITLPEKDQFHSEDAYYATALHELGHWTGHESRLDRDLAHPFGSEGYAKEELRAEIASYMIGQDLEIGHDPGQHASYVGSWVKVLKEDPKEIFAAARDAQKIANFVKEFENEKEVSEAEKEDQESHEKPEGITDKDATETNSRNILAAAIAAKAMAQDATAEISETESDLEPEPEQEPEPEPEPDSEMETDSDFASVLAACEKEDREAEHLSFSGSDSLIPEPPPPEPDQPEF